MCGVALTIRSPSSSSTRRSVVWVAGCWGPKFRVQRYCCSSVEDEVAPITSSSSRFVGIRPSRSLGGCFSKTQGTRRGRREYFYVFLCLTLCVLCAFARNLFF